MKKLLRLFAAILIICLVSTTALAADIKLEPTVLDNGTVTVRFTLDAVPANLKDVSAITIRYTYDESKLEYVSTVGNGELFENLIGNKGNIVWYDETFDSSKAITAQKLDELDGLLFTLNFKKAENIYGNTDIEITFAELAASDFAIGKDVNFEITSVNLGEEPDSGTGDDTTGSDNTGSDNTGSDNTGSDNTGSDNTGGDNTGSDNTGSDNTGGDNTGSDNTGGDNTGSDNTGSDNTGGDNTGGDNTGGDNTGSDNADSGTTGGSNSDDDDGGKKGGGSKVTGGGSFTPSAPKPAEFPGFADIPKDNWGYTHAYSLMQKGIVAGDGAEMPSMRPNDCLTRAEAAKIALLAMGVKPEAGLALEFTDASSVAQWAVPYIATAVKYGILTGYTDGRVGAGDNITREQMLTILARAMKWQIKDSELAFTDNADISDWAKPAIAYAAELGVMKGYDDGSVRPKDNITRIEVFALVDRCLK